uniref:Putative adaptor protein with pleckstrin homology and src homology 2 domains n=1 Tax=Schistosoma japonicum TaxID=6182 RepID=C1L473_SCHJA|nr:putative adaptor protein with pleckstrin homology and src homology 2 domains [Schistosoma japonicum]
MTREETWSQFCSVTSTRLSIEALHLFKAYLNDHRHDDKPGCGLEFLEIIFKKMRRKFETSLSPCYFVREINSSGVALSDKGISSHFIIFIMLTTFYPFSHIINLSNHIF